MAATCSSTASSSTTTRSRSREKGVVAIEHSDFDGTERLAAVLGADIVSTFDTPELVKLGTCDVIEEIMLGEDKVIQFKGCARDRLAPSSCAARPPTSLRRLAGPSTTPLR